MFSIKWAGHHAATRRLVSEGKLTYAQSRWFQRGMSVYGHLPESEQIQIAKDRAHTAAVTSAAKGGFFERVWRGVKKVATWAYKVAPVVVGVAAFKYALAHPLLSAISVYGASTLSPFIQNVPVLGKVVKYATIGAGAAVAWRAGRAVYGWYKAKGAFFNPGGMGLSDWYIANTS